ncbi:putative triacylglycerol lipase [Helianthus annuus]|nr:putative triacylglycerol lipase [Helianthus annuus]
MASEQKRWLAVHVIAIIFLSLNNVAYEVNGDPQVPCYFIFGDSLVDNGNNNGIASLARANYLPYGIDFPDGPTGRFSNGKTVVDTVGKLQYFRLLLTLSYTELVRKPMLVKRSFGWVVKGCGATINIYL